VLTVQGSVTTTLERLMLGSPTAHNQPMLGVSCIPHFRALCRFFGNYSLIIQK